MLVYRRLKIYGKVTETVIAIVMTVDRSVKGRQE